MSVLLYSDIEHYSTTYVFHTYPEKGHHLHHVPLPYIAYKVHKMFHDKDLDVHQPKADVRETLTNFYPEVELPGIKDKDEIHLRWTSMRTLLITAKVARPEIPQSDLEEVSNLPPKETLEKKKTAYHRREELKSSHQRHLTAVESFIAISAAWLALCMILRNPSNLVDSPD
jgi:hypothetical protein